MVIACVVLSVLCVLLVGVAVWGWMDRLRSATRLSSAETALEGAIEQRDRLVHELSDERARRQEQAELVAQLRADAAGLNTTIESLRVQHQADLKYAQELREAERENAEEKLAGVREHHERVLKQEVAAAEQRRRDLEQSIVRLKDEFQKVFGSLAGDALKKAGEQFLSLAAQKLETSKTEADSLMQKRHSAVDELIKPIRETLAKQDQKLEQLEKDRVQAYAGLREQVNQSLQGQAALREETSKLVRALREPQVRGRYGEFQLRRVAELAGMRPYCDFVEQESTRDGDGNLLRPDMIVRLPAGRELAVDAKANLKPYLEAMEAVEPEAVESCLKRYADGIAGQAALLGKKGYWRQYAGSPDFVVMFLPGDQLLDAALARRPDLLEHAAAMNVILVSPASLIAMLRAVAVGWREKHVAEQAAELIALGRELHERASVALGHAGDLGKCLDRAVEKYNAFVGSYQSRLSPTLKKFEELGVKGSRELAEVSEVTVRPRSLEGVVNSEQ